jgi:hypothetical protein
VRRVLEPQTVDVLTDILTTVVKEGTGRHAPSRLRGRGQDGHGPEGRRSGPLLDDRSRGLVRGLRPVRHPAFVILVSLDSPKGLRTRAETWPRPSSRGSPSTRSGISRCPPTIPTGCSGSWPTRRCTLTPAAYRPEPARATPADGREPGSCPTCGASPRARAALAAARRGLIVELRGSGPWWQTPEAWRPRSKRGMTGVLTWAQDRGGAAVKLRSSQRRLPEPVTGEPVGRGHRSDARLARALEPARCSWPSRASSPTGTVRGPGAQEGGRRGGVRAARGREDLGSRSGTRGSPWPSSPPRPSATRRRRSPRRGHGHERQDHHDPPHRRGLRAAGRRRSASWEPSTTASADRLTTASRTTPESSDLQASLREMVDAGCRRACSRCRRTRLERSASRVPASRWRSSRT